MPSSTSSSERARALIGRLGAFLGLTLLLLAGLEVAVRAMVSDPFALKYAELRQAPRAGQNLVLGASNTLGGIDPLHLDAAGVRWYNHAFTSANPAFFRRWYRLYRASNPAPARLIYGADWFMFQAGFLERTLEVDSEHLPLEDYLRLWLEPNASFAALLTNRSALLKHRIRLKNMLFLQEPALAPQPYHQGCMTRPVGNYAKLPPPGHTLNRAMVTEFEALLDTLRADRVAVILVQLPSYLPEIGEHPRQQAQLQAIARERGLTYLNYNGDRRSAFNRDRSLFADWVHLNARGAERISRRLAEDLAALGVIPRRQPNEAFSGVSR